MPTKEPTNVISQKPFAIHFRTLSKRRLNLFGSYSQFETISFGSQQELEKKLSHFLTNVKKRSSWLNKDIQLTVYSNINNPAANTTDPKPLPAYFAQSLFKIINHNTFITEVKLENKLFTQREKEEITQLAQARQKEKARRESRMNYFFLLGGLNGLLATIGQGLALPMIALKVVGESLLSAFFGYVRQKYLDFSASYYSANKKVKNKNERLAFQYGVKSESMWEYIKSFFRLSTYLHPLAFAAGLEHALEKNSHVIAKVLNKPLMNEKRFVLRAQIKRKPSISAPTSQNVYSSWIHFNDGEDLQSQLQNLVNEYQSDFSLFTRAAKLSLRKEDGMQLPSFVSRSVQEIIVDNQCIQEVSFKPNGTQNLFTPQEINELRADSKQNAKGSKRRIHRFFDGLFYSSVIGAFFNAIIPFAFLSGLYNYYRQSFLDWTIKPYNTKSKIAKITNPAEQKALLYGVKAGKSYKELCYSWGRKEAYTQFCAFEAGKEIAMEGNTALIQEIKRFSPAKPS